MLILSVVYFLGCICFKIHEYITETPCCCKGEERHCRGRTRSRELHPSLESGWWCWWQWYAWS